MNNENSYNLIDETWIPVLMKDGSNRAVSLGDIFKDKDGVIADLALNPYERVAVFRLLLCIAQAALGPDRLKDEDAWKAAKSDVGPISTDYLRKWHHRFFLYGPHAFLQPDDVVAVRDDAMTSCDKLVFHFSSGNKSTLFDHGATDAGRMLPDELLALSLVSFQNFSAGGLSGTCSWSGAETERSVKGAPCREQSMLFTILVGGTLMESIWMNLLSEKTIANGLLAEWGHPVWELETLSRSSSEELAKTFLGHLVPLSRAIKFSKGASVCILGGGVVYPQLPAWRDQMASVKLKEDGILTYVSSDPSRLPWRDLASVLQIRGTGGRKSALAMQHLENLPCETSFTIWTGGLYAEKAKEIATVEWSASLPVSILEESALQRYETAIDWAERQRSALRFAARAYSDKMKFEEASRFYGSAESAYWDTLSQPENQKIVQNVESETYMDDWKKVTRKAAEVAYSRACSAVTARQMEAFAQGYSKLRVQ